MKNLRIGVYVCNCGTNIAKIIDAEAVAKYASNLPNVAIAKTYKYMCSNPGQEMIARDIKENELDRVVVAACSPNMHERTFRHALQMAGLNQYLLEMANITYVIHLMAVTPWLLRMPFSKWAHMIYRPLAMYFAAIQRAAFARQDNLVDSLSITIK